MGSCMIDNLNRDIILIAYKYIYDYNFKKINQQITRLIARQSFGKEGYTVIKCGTDEHYAINDRSNDAVIDNLSRGDPIEYIRHYTNDFKSKTLTQHKIPVNYW